MSPIIHAAVGWLIGQPLKERRDRIVVAVAAVAPDIDGLGLLVSEELYVEWHHRLAHGAIAAVVVTTGEAPLTSTTRASFVEGPPPATSVFPMSKIAWAP